MPDQRSSCEEITGVLESVKQVLELVASGTPLDEVLGAVTSLVEQQSPGDVCSVLLLSKDGRRLHSAAGASLPPGYAKAIDGSEIGPAAGSCGTAAFTRQRVIVTDIATDPRWEPYKGIALTHGLRACWSQPVISRDGRKVLGTVAHYSSTPGEPAAESLRLLETAAHLAQIAIEQSHDITERKRADAHLLTEAAVTRVLATSATVAEAVPRLLEAVSITCGWEVGAFWRLDEAAQAMRCETIWRRPSLEAGDFEQATLAAAFTLGVGLPGRVWAGGHPAWITDARDDPNFPRQAMAKRAGLRGALGIPVLLAGKVIGVMEFFTRSAVLPDLQLDAMLAILGDQVGQFIDRINAADELRAAKDAAERANRARERFLAMLSHELRTPLSPALLIATSMSVNASLPAEARQDAQMICKNIQLQARLIDDLLDLTRIDNDKLVLVHETLDLHELLLDCVKLCEADASAKGIGVACELSAGRRTVSGDPSRLRQVFCNVLKNAVKFTPSGGGVRVATDDADGQRISVTVSDTGIGAEADALAKLFNAFEQAGRSRESRGLGLGLAICKGLIEAHGGSIRASSEGVGRGMTVTINLPVLPVAESAAERPRQPDFADPQAPLRILLVDDHADTLRAMSRLLRQMEHRVITADCVSSALSVAESEDFDLLISDVGLPDGTGTELMRELLKRKPVKGIALTGYGMESDIQETREAGFFAHLTKPIDFAQLQQAIRQGASASAH